MCARRRLALIATDELGHKQTQSTTYVPVPPGHPAGLNPGPFPYLDPPRLQQLSSFINGTKDCDFISGHMVEMHLASGPNDETVTHKGEARRELNRNSGRRAEITDVM